MAYQFDFLVIGSGVAGLSYALKVADHGSVAVVSKRQLSESNSYYAQGGVAAVWSETDSIERHIQDTLSAGGGLCHRDVVKLTVSEGPARIRELQDMGVQFSMRDPDTRELDLGREGGHTKRRILHVDDSTGKALIEVLSRQVRAHRNIQVFEYHLAVDLAMRHRVDATCSRGETCCLGAYVLNEQEGSIHTFRAPVTVVASGGAGKVYLYTSNPDVATGDGIAMAYRAGAHAANMEFYQFHPTCLYHPKAKSFLVSEAVRGEGAELVHGSGEPFMHRYHSMGSLAPRDITARAIDTELKRSGVDCVFLDIASKHEPDFIRDRFPGIHQRCLGYGIDITKEPIPVVPAAHYCCGGIMTDTEGRTNVPGLFVVGESAFTGLHGANRLASNSLLEALVFAHRAAGASLKPGLAQPTVPGANIPPWDAGHAVDNDEAVVITQTWEEIRRFMWNYVGIVRTLKRLKRALKRIILVREEIEAYYWNFTVTRDLLELRNLALVAELIIRSAMGRKESRGLHYNADYPEADDDLFGRDTIL